MIQYFQLTPEILLEYVYADEPKLNEDGIKGNEKDICKSTSTMMLKSNAFGTKYMCFADENEGLDSISNLVLPLNNSETQFVVVKNKYQNFFDKFNASNIYSTKNGSVYMYEDTKYDSFIKGTQNSCDVKYDKCILHFTSRNYFGSYDSLIFQTYVYLKNKSKMYLSSFIFRRTSNLEFKAEHMLYREKLYTAQAEFDIPSVYAIFGNDNVDFNNAIEAQGVDLLENTPVGVNVYGVLSTIKGDDNYEKLKTTKIKSISIPYIYNRLDEIQIDIHESADGDYYEISPKMSLEYSSSDTSFVNYIESLGDNILAYMIMHELQLKEVWVDGDGTLHSQVTHKEYHIIDVSEDDTKIDIAKRFSTPIKYRPICSMCGWGYGAFIIDTLKVMNTVDGSSYEVTSSIQISNANKYGNRLRSIDVSNRPIVNVYNKKVSEENSTKNNLLNMNMSKGGGFVIENMTQNISSFIESTNIGVSIVELSPEDMT